MWGGTTAIVLKALFCMSLALMMVRIGFAEQNSIFFYNRENRLRAQILMFVSLLREVKR